MSSSPTSGAKDFLAEHLLARESFDSAHIDRINLGALEAKQSVTEEHALTFY